MNTDNMNDDHLNDLPVFKPDLSVVYPNKHELYRKETASPVIGIKRLMIAASLLLTTGIIWWLVGQEEPQQQPVVSVIPVGSNDSSENREPKEIKKEIIIEKPTLAQQAKIKIKKVQASLPVVTSGEIVSSNKVEEELLSKKNVQDEIVINQAIHRLRSNFSEEALQSAQLIAQELTENKKQQEVKSTVNVPITASDERKRPFRGLVRKLSRTILGEGESLGDEDIVRVANFKIPVSNQ